ncbi:hypothetical protein GCM10027594_21200 [Hymenobacter agri]
MSLLTITGTHKGPRLATVSPQPRVFFPNLNGLRFLAVLLVVIDHAEGLRADYGLSNYWYVPAIPLLGQLGVDLFFVLSGFLITYLLLAEKQKLGTIDFRAFYLRRMLRIWPLYYVLVFLALFVFPHIDLLYHPGLTPRVAPDLGVKTLLYAVMLPNVAKELYPAVPFASQAWSIGVEEQFYLVWPVVVFYSSRYYRNFLLLAAVVFVVMQLSWALTGPSRQLVPVNELTDFIKHFLTFFRIQCMAIGGVFAVLLFRRKGRLLDWLTSRPVQVAVWLVLPVLIVRGQEVRYFTHELYAVLFEILILNLALTQSSLVSLRSAWLDYLGRILYGLYMFHSLAIGLAIRLLGVNRLSATANHAAVYVVALAISYQ